VLQRWGRDTPFWSRPAARVLAPHRLQGFGGIMEYLKPNHSPITEREEVTHAAFERRPAAPTGPAHDQLGAAFVYEKLKRRPIVLRWSWKSG
jgi:hypothetical protein